MDCLWTSIEESKWRLRPTGNGITTNARRLLANYIDQRLDVDFIISGRPKDAFSICSSWGLIY